MSDVNTILSERFVGKVFLGTSFKDYEDAYEDYDPRGKVIENVFISHDREDGLMFIEFDDPKDYGHFYVYPNEEVFIKDQS